MLLEEIHVITRIRILSICMSIILLEGVLDGLDSTTASPVNIEPIFVWSTRLKIQRSCAVKKENKTLYNCGLTSQTLGGLREVDGQSLPPSTHRRLRLSRLPRLSAGCGI